MTPEQLVVSLVTITLFVPCVAHFFVTMKERGWKTGVLIFLVSLVVAVLVGALTGRVFVWF